MDETSFKIFIFSLICSIFIFCGVFILSIKLGENNNVNVKYVDNPSVFFTVESCVNKYVSLIVSKDAEAIYNVIDSKYRKENEITLNNVLANNKKIEGYYTFVASKMLEDKDTKYKYYVKGYLLEESFSEDVYSSEKIDYSLIVKLDVSNNTYSVILDEVGEYFDAV